MAKLATRHLLTRVWWLAIIAIVSTLLALAYNRKTDGDYVFNQYSERLARVLEIDAEDLPPHAIQPSLIPLTTRTSANAMQAYQLSVEDWWSIKHCRINQLIAQRNSSLGRVQQASQRLKYEMAIVSALKQCALTTTEPHQTSLLDTLLKHKQQQLINVWHHLWLSDEALSKSFVLASSGLSITSKQTQAEMATIEQSLQYLKGISEQIKTLSQSSMSNLDDALVPVAFDGVMESLYHSNGLAKLWFSQHLALQTLTTSSQLLSRTQVACNAQQTVLIKQFFGNYYSKQVQPQLVLLQRYGQRIDRILQPLLATFPHAIALRYQQVQQHQPLAAAIQQHAELWQQQLADCGVKPGG
ncbi:DUF3080 domain-containing protein [Neiella marina]|uniref:DUF3080 domain-containing protein n=1 Tax=Neiella holothuriorum TaxID=2870530 RepID=A0ABS7EI18_9GAMM|nr:DUF3080 family protein [Neiella holothuriorum]MBW8191543.1 DUF3080 domain-containing protein [Neiella holothuriorum]